MQSLSDDLLLGVLEYLADPADWARCSATCRRFRYNVRGAGAPLCLQLVQLQQTRTSTSISSTSFYLPQLIFVEFQDSKRLVSRAHHHHHQEVDDASRQLADATTKYRLFTFHAGSNARAYLGCNHEHPSGRRSIETHVHGLAFHVDRAPCSSFRSCQQHQYWILHPNDLDNNNNDDDDESSLLFVTRQLQVMGICDTCPPIIYHSAARLLNVDYNGNWFVHALPIAAFHHHGSHDGAAAAVTQRPPMEWNTYGLQLWTPPITSTITTHHDDNRDVVTQTTTRRLFLPEIPIQPKPFLSHNGGWNVYEPNAWESVLHTDVRNGMTRHAQLGRCTSLYFHLWMRDSHLYIHAQYLVFPLRIPILQQDQNVELGDERHDGHYLDNDDDKKAYMFLCNFLWNLFAHDSPRWYAIRHYLSMAANELGRLQQMTRRLVERGGDPVATPILPPPARVDDVEDAQDDGSMGLTATHAANTWIIVPLQHQREYSYQAVYAEDPDRPQLRPWKNVLSVVLSDEDASLHPNAPNVAKNMTQPAWSIVFYA
jgi:F-box-like